MCLIAGRVWVQGGSATVGVIRSRVGCVAVAGHGQRGPITGGIIGSMSRGLHTANRVLYMASRMVGSADRNVYHINRICVVL